MKNSILKGIVSILVVAALSLVAFSLSCCDKDSPSNYEPRCWEIHYYYQGVSVTGYIWATEAELKEVEQEIKNDRDYSNFSYRKHSASDEYSCEALNYPEEVVPNTPSGLSASVTSSCIELTWNSVSDATSYNVYRSTSASGSYSLLKNVSSAEYTDCSVSSETTYYYKVSAKNGAGESDKSAYVSAKVSSGGGGGQTEALPAPTGFTLTQTSSGIKLSWNRVTGAAGYAIFRALPSDTKYSYHAQTTSTSYTDTDVESGQTYYYAVAAFDSESNVGDISTGYITFSGSGGGGSTTKPSTPSGLNASASSSCIDLTWNSASGASSYNVYRSTSASGTYSYLSNTYSTYYTDCSVSSGTTYYYKVSAENSAGESDKSSYASAKVSSGGGGGGGTTSYSPCPPNVTCSGTSSVTVKWTASTGTGCGKPTSYDVKRTNRITGSAETLKSSTTSTSFTDSQPFPGINMYGVVATNDQGTAAGTAISSEIGIKAPEFYDGMGGNSYSVTIDIKGLNVPDEWKPYYKLELHWAQSSSGSYTALASWNYYDYKMSVGNNAYCYIYDFGNVDFSGKTFYYKLRWVFNAPYSPSAVNGAFTSVKSVKH